MKIVASNTRCIVYNKKSNSAHELVFKDLKTEPTVKTIWDNAYEPLMNITGGCDGRFVLSTAEASYILTGDKLEKVVIGDEWTGGTDEWALGDGWEIWCSGGGKIYGRGKSKEFRIRLGQSS